MKTKLQGLLTLFLVLLVQITFAQERTVSGVVSDNNGMPLPGANVNIKGTKTGVSTDIDGKFAIKASSNQTLIFSYIGMNNQEVSAASTNLKVKMQSNAVELEGVVINSLGVEVKKNQRASAYSKVKGDALRSSGESNVIKSLSGKASNVVVVSNSGDPGSGSYIQIRGQNTITGNSQPLFVVDGIPVSNDESGSDVDGVGQQSRLNDINPNDVENVQILKGVSASAIWGYRAANGVVLITTKKGRKGKISVELNSTYSYDNVNTRFKTQDIFGQGINGSWARNNPNSWGDLISNRAGGSDVYNTSGAYFVSNDGSVIYPVSTKRSKDNFNDSNYDSVINKGFSLDTHVGLSGGNENGNFYLGLGHYNQEGIIQSSTYERTTVDFSSSYNLSSKTTFKSKFSYSSVNSNRIQQGSNTSGLLLGLYRTPADFDNSDYKGTYYNATGIPYYNSQRTYRQLGTFEYDLPSDDLNPGYNNPLWTTNVQKNPNKVNRYIAGFQLQHELTKGLSILGRFGIDAYSDQRISMFNKSSVENGGNGSASESVTDFQQYNVDIMALGDLNINSNLGLNYTVGVNMAETNIAQRGGSYKNFLIDSDKFSYANSLLADRTTFLNRENDKLNGAYFSTAFDYKKYLFVTLGGRFETASTFDPNLKVYFYPTAEVAYQLSEHVKNSVLSSSKLRASFGQVAIIPTAYNGNDYFVAAVGSEGWGPAYDSGAYGGSFQRSDLKGNDKLKPEIKTEFELGADLEFFNRFKVNATYYTNKVKDNLVPVSINGSSSYGRLYGNFADISNKGFEIEFSADILKKSALKWSIYGNWATNKNLVTRLDGTQSLFLNGFAGSSSRAVLNEPLGVLWGGRWNRDANNNLVLDANGFPTVAPTEGVIGNPNPKWRGGIGTKLEYKGFSLNTLFDASIGGQLWDGTNGALNNFGRSMETSNITTLSSTDAANIFTYNGNSAASVGWLNSDGTYSVRGNVVNYGAGPVLLNQDWYQSLGGGFGPVSEQFVKSASWVKLREVSLAYKLSDKKILNKTGISSITLSLSGRNLWLWTEDKTLGQDPESNLTGGSNGRGLQYFNHPNTKSYIATINIKF